MSCLPVCGELPFAVYMLSVISIVSFFIYTICWTDLFASFRCYCRCFILCTQSCHILLQVWDSCAMLCFIEILHVDIDNMGIHVLFYLLCFLALLLEGFFFVFVFAETQFLNEFLHEATETTLAKKKIKNLHKPFFIYSPVFMPCCAVNHIALGLMHLILFFTFFK